MVTIKVKISDEDFARLLKERRITGSMKMDLMTREVAYKAFRKTHGRKKDKLVRRLEHGWVKESTENYKLFVSVCKDLGLARIFHVLQREEHEAEQVLFDYELIENM